ncbi:hypothetical protein PFLUV_G00217830 [Perca fluviatilis]|uniref:Galectin n=1 Tax=Perca fluviatilis TaxID=8168 RepID=A0A6A5DT53_PERFL|nr:hypothetical protein PFLUV_G00217830 [Perca fluviatilis]
MREDECECVGYARCQGWVIPFAGTILGGLLPGEMVLIQGSVPSDADRFQVDFTCGSSVKPRADVAFHFNPRFRRSACVVCNSLQSERWGREEVLHAKPFAAGETFELIVLVLKDAFKVAVNGAHVLEYKHRVDLDRVDTLSISGKVHVGAVGILANTGGPGRPDVADLAARKRRVQPLRVAGQLQGRGPGPIRTQGQESP